MFVVSITGGIGAGKTAVSNRFAAHGIKVVDADAAAREVVRPGTPALAEIVARFGARILDEGGNLDRAALRGIVFADSAQRIWLERLLHPRIAEHMRNALEEADSPYAILVSPLAVERAGNGRRSTRILLVDAPEDTQIERTMARDRNTEDQVRAIMAAQASRTERIAYADDIIVNDAGLDELHAAVDRLHARYLTLCRTHEND